MSNDSKKKYNTISAELRNEIKKRYESGENLLDLAMEYNLNYGTLKNYASKKKWEKNKRAELVYAMNFLMETEEDVAERNEILKHFKTLGKSYLAYFLELEKKGNRPTKKAVEEALKNRMQAAEILKSFLKDIHNFRSPEEQARLVSAVLELEKLKADLDTAQGTVDIE